MDRPLKVLIIEDSVADAEIDVLTLQQSGLKVQAQRVETELEYLLELRKDPDIVLSTHTLPAFDAQRALKLLRDQNPETPFIVVSGRIGEAAVVDLMKAGASDVVRKDSLARLTPAVRRELGTAEKRRRTRRTAEKLELEERKHDDLIQNLPGMVYRLRVDGDSWRFDFVSEGCKALTGYGTDTLVGGEGFELGRLLYGEAKQDHNEELRQVLMTEGNFTLEHQILCANGDVKWVWHRGAAVRSLGGGLQYVEGFLADMTSRKVDQAKLDYLAHHDVLTGLSNRTVFEEQLGRSLERVKRHFHNVTLLFIDLDEFKDINDTAGHQAGDAVLRTIAGRLMTSSRKGDIVARLGGDEFAVVLDDNEKTEDVAEIVPRILEEIGRPIKLPGREVAVTASIGIAVYPVDGEDVTTLLKNADAAMYAAKESGRNTFRFFARKMNERAKSLVVMRNALQRAVRKQEFDLDFQPLVRLADRRIVGLEALVRWRHSPNARMTAEHFIPFAEDAGVVASIDRWVLRSACRRAAEWAEAGIPYGRIACNLSSQALSDQKLPEELKGYMAEYAVDPDWLEVEINEATLMQGMIATRVTLEKIAEMGVRLTLDDFGTGYSSLIYLQRFPIQRLKIDREFVKDVPWREDDVQTCRAILALAESLRIEVVAEGVEKKEQEVFLHHAGCDLAQGHLFSRPLPAERCAQFLREGPSLMEPDPARAAKSDITERLISLRKQ